jgi:hypothetical protein
MKSIFDRPLYLPCHAALLLLLFSCPTFSTATAALQEQPVIREVRIQNNEVLVHVDIPSGIKKVTLESRPRLGRGAWEPRAVSRLEGAGGTILFRLPITSHLEILRVRADAQEPLPSSFYEGESWFAGQPGPDLDSPPPTAPPEEPNPGNDGRDVVESDIWRIQEDTVYFFNQFRGLQIIDVSDADAPVIQGTLELPAAGEQMYLLGTDRVLLLARDGCDWGPQGPESQVLIIHVENGIPKLEGSLPVPGNIQESRLVGTALYIASHSYRPVTISSDSDATAAPEGEWEWGTVISSFDLADPASPVEKESLWFSGYGHTIHATDTFLFLATREPAHHFRSVIHSIDISAPDGATSRRGSILAAGYVKDKFKMNLEGTVFTVISQSWDDNRRWSTSLETFDFANPAVPERLALLELAEGEELHATRFDGAKAYIVTFFRVDPLWVIDLSDPLNPQIAGELEVPGWSTYIEPMGDRLLTMGIDDVDGWRVAISLFDVKDPANPTLLDKVPLGENNSWSEANHDEKALRVLPEAGLILVPYQGQTDRSFANRVQLIDLHDTTLTARGMIEHAFQPRRTALHRDRILSLSGMELLSVNATDRDHPVVSSKLNLGWAADRLFLLGDYLIQIENGRSWGTSMSPTIRVSTSAAPETILNRVQLERTWPIAGTALRGNKLYVVQTFPENSGGEEFPESANLVLSVVNLASLPELDLISETGVTAGNWGWNPSLQPLWPKPDLLVWSGGSSDGWWDGPEPFPANQPASMALPWFGGGIGRQFLAFELRDGQAPEFVSEINLTPDQGWHYSSFSTPFTESELVYISHPLSQFVEMDPPVDGEPPPPDPNLPPPDDTWPPDTTTPPDDSQPPDNTRPPGDGPPPDEIPPPDELEGTSPDGSLVPLQNLLMSESVVERKEILPSPAPFGSWIQRDYLYVIDFSDSRAPTVRRPVNIPGTLKGISHGGALIYTTGPRFDEQGQPDGHEHLHASAYDGVSASLVSSMPLPNNWPRPLLWTGADFILAVPGDNPGSSQLQTWTLSEQTGTWLQTGSLQIPLPAQNLHLFGDLLVAQANRELLLLDASDPRVPRDLQTASLPGCIYFDFNRAIGSLEKGLWIGLGDYGVGTIQIGK